MAIIEKKTCAGGADLVISAAKAAQKAAAEAEASAKLAQDQVERVKPHIGTNGHWYVGDEDTFVPASGTPGPKGEAGAKGETGFSPYIGANGNWYDANGDTFVPATTDLTPYVTKTALTQTLLKTPDVIATTNAGWEEAITKTTKPNIYIIRQ